MDKDTPKYVCKRKEVENTLKSIMIAHVNEENPYLHIERLYGLVDKKVATDFLRLIGMPEYIT